jgi:hypothetical protein
MSDAYANRTDLNNAANRVARSVAPGQTYGKATQQMEAQRAVPMGSSPTDAPVQRPTPGTLGSLTRRTERPSEPITAGAPFGAGPGPIASGIPTPTGDNALEELRAIYQMFPNDDLADLIDSYTRDGF